MRRFMVLIVVAALLFSGVVCNKSEAADIHNPGESIKDWKVAMQFLVDGNKRFVDNQTITRNTNALDREILKDSQKPFAVIVTCSDSRVAPEIYFDQKLGDIFVVRNAGNIADSTALGSIEFAVGYLKAPLVIVVGHGSCGAVIGALNGGDFPENLQSVLDKISPAIKGCENPHDAILANIKGVSDQIKNNAIVKSAEAKVIGAYYDIVTGVVTFKEN